MTSNILAQTNTSYFNGKHKVHYYKATMADSAGNYYTDWIDISALDTYVHHMPINYLLSSAAGKPYVTTSLEGRIFDPVANAWETGVTVDAFVTADSTETMVTIVTGLAGGERPDQVRLKFDGVANGAGTINRSDVIIQAWVKVLRRED